MHDDSVCMCVGGAKGVVGADKTGGYKATLSP